MNRQTITPISTQRLIASPMCRNLPDQRPQASRPGWDAYPGPDEDTSDDPAGALTLSYPRLFCLLAVAPDELHAVVDGFLS
jgi:hypothetical protein